MTGVQTCALPICTILGDHGAELLLGQGDMLLSSGSGQPLRIHGAYVGDDEIDRVTAALREQGEPAYVPLFAGLETPVPVALEDRSPS